MKRLLVLIAGAGIGLWLAALSVPNVVVQALPDSQFFGFHLTQQWQLLILFAIILGLLNFFVKPILDTITLPLRIITLGAFSFVINMGLLWVVDYLFRELNIPLIYPLLWTTFIVWMVSALISKLLIK